jgi:P4 family phage/plasmid primase-like protien
MTTVQRPDERCVAIDVSAPGPDVVDDVRTYLDAVFAEGEGSVCMAVGTPGRNAVGKYTHLAWQEFSLRWPSDSDEVCRRILSESEASDVYLCPYLMADDHRRGGNSTFRRIVHAEVDCLVSPDSVITLGGFAVSSGSPGHAHVYVPLTESVSLEDHRRLCGALGEHFGAKDRKIADNDVLRPPGTYNHKPTVMDSGGGRAVRVRWLVKPNGVRVDSQHLAALLGADLGGGLEVTSVATEPLGSDFEEVPDFGRRYPTVQAALDHVTADRSADTIRITKACRTNGLTLAQTRWVVHQREDLRERIEDRTDDDIARCYLRAGSDEGSDCLSTERSAAEGDSGTTLVQPRLEDAYISAHVAEKLMGEFVHSGALGWLQFDGRRWKATTESSVIERVRNELIDLHATEAKAQAEVDRLRRLSGLLSTSKIRAVTFLIKAKLTAKGDFDAHPDLLNVRNGVVDLRTGQLWPHDADLLLTKVAPVDYKANATHADWSSALAALPDEAAEWLQMRLGQGITGHPVSDDRLVVLRGSGANGKTTILDAVRTALGGDFAVTMPERVLLARPGDHPTELMTLRGARLALMEELPELGHLNAKRLKDLVGTGEMTGRYIHRDSVAWKPTHTPMVTTNYLPRVDESDEGTWRRLVLLEFPYRFRRDRADVKTGNDRLGDPNLRERLRAGETGQPEAVLAWLVGGAVRWYQHGRQMPPDPNHVVEATRRWRHSSDLLLRYIDECLEIDPGYHVRATELFQAFTEWLGDSGHRSWSDQSFSSRLSQHKTALDHGIEKKRIRPSHSTIRSHRYGIVINDLEADTGDTGGSPGGQCNAWLGIRFRRGADSDVET